MLQESIGRLDAEIAPMTDGLACTRCKEPALPDRPYCARHLKLEVERWSKAQRKRRARLKRQKRCRWCGKRSPDRTVCRDCRPVVTSVVTTDLPSSEEISTPAAELLERQRSTSTDIATRTTRDYESGGDGYNGGNRARFHGRPHRGHPSRKEEDSWDLKMIVREFERGEAKLGEYYSDEVQGWPPIQREAKLAEALGHFDLADRSLEELRERMRRRLR